MLCSLSCVPCPCARCTLRLFCLFFLCFTCFLRFNLLLSLFFVCLSTLFCAFNAPPHTSPTSAGGAKGGRWESRKSAEAMKCVCSEDWCSWCASFHCAADSHISSSFTTLLSFAFSSVSASSYLFSSLCSCFSCVSSLFSLLFGSSLLLSSSRDIVDPVQRGWWILFETWRML